MNFLLGVCYLLIGIFGIMLVAALVVFLVMIVKFIQELWRDN